MPADVKFEKFNGLPPEIKIEVAKQLASKDLSTLALSSKDHYRLFQPMLYTRKLLHHVARGEEDAAQTMLEGNIELLVKKGLVTDYSNRTFPEVTAFQYALWAMDYHMWKMMLNVLQKWANEGSNYKRANEIRITLLEQYNHVVKNGLVYTGIIYTWDNVTNSPVKDRISVKDAPFFNLQPLINSLRSYSTMGLEKDWGHIVGMLQRLVPAHVAQQYCGPLYFNKAHYRNKLLRSFQVSDLVAHDFKITDIHSWFPLSPNNGLGFNFGIHIDRVARRSTMPRRTHSRWDSQALSTRLDTRTEDAAALRPLLSAPFEKPDLDTSPKMS